MYDDLRSGAEPPEPLWTDVPADERRRETAAPSNGQCATSRLTWMLIILAFMMVLSYFVPYMVEQIQYASTRGRELAEYEIAREGLDNLPLAELSTACQMISQRVGPSVVHITVAGRDRLTMPSMLGPTDRFRTGQGSGVIVDESGYILTNRHVVVDSNQIEVKLSDGRSVPAEVIGVDKLTDLAVLKINANKLIAADFGDSDEVKVGALVWALGSPFGLERSITFGILSAKHRAQKAGTPYQDFLQTDAAVNPGNSGGPLVDARGRVIGINTAIVGESYQGISFAIPSSVAQEVYHRIRQNGRVARGWLGVRPMDVPEAVARELGIARSQGALVQYIVNPSPAGSAGIRPGDVILRWNGQAVTDATALYSFVADTEAGQSVVVTLNRGGQEIEVTVDVVERENE